MAVSIAVSTAVVCWLGYLLPGYMLAGAFNALPPNATACLLMWTGCAGLAVAMTWKVVNSYRRAFPSQRRKQPKSLNNKNILILEKRKWPEKLAWNQGLAAACDTGLLERLRAPLELPGTSHQPAKFCPCLRAPRARS